VQPSNSLPMATAAQLNVYWRDLQADHHAPFLPFPPSAFRNVFIGGGIPCTRRDAMIVCYECSWPMGRSPVQANVCAYVCVCVCARAPSRRRARHEPGRASASHQRHSEGR
jgi:hypothetical protein